MCFGSYKLHNQILKSLSEIHFCEVVDYQAFEVK